MRENRVWVGDHRVNRENCCISEVKALDQVIGAIQLGCSRDWGMIGKMTRDKVTYLE